MSLPASSRYRSSTALKKASGTAMGLPVTSVTQLLLSYLQQNATPEDIENHIDIADLLIRSHSGLDPESPRKRCLSFLRAARFIAPEHQDEVEALINDLDLDFWGAEKDEAGEEEPSFAGLTGEFHPIPRQNPKKSAHCVKTCQNAYLSLRPETNQHIQ